jgi:hypothetical protein
MLLDMVGQEPLLDWWLPQGLLPVHTVSTATPTHAILTLSTVTCLALQLGQCCFLPSGCCGGETLQPFLHQPTWEVLVLCLSYFMGGAFCRACMWPPRCPHSSRTGRMRELLPASSSPPTQVHSATETSQLPGKDTPPGGGVMRTMQFVCTRSASGVESRAANHI